MPQDQRYGRPSSRRDWEDERNRDYGYGRDDWRNESRLYRSRRYEDEGGGSAYGRDRRQDRDYQGTLRAGDYGRYEEEEGRSYPERFGGDGYAVPKPPIPNFYILNEPVSLPASFPDAFGPTNAYQFFQNATYSLGHHL